MNCECETCRDKEPVGWGVAVVLILLAALAPLIAGCASMPHAKTACTGPGTREQAAAMVAPKLGPALMCVTQHDTKDEIKQCVGTTFAPLMTEAQPVVWQCGLAMVEDLVSAARK